MRFAEFENNKKGARDEVVMLITMEEGRLLLEAMETYCNAFKRKTKARELLSTLSNAPLFP